MKIKLIREPYKVCPMCKKGRLGVSRKYKEEENKKHICGGFLVYDCYECYAGFKEVSDEETGDDIFEYM